MRAVAVWRWGLGMGDMVEGVEREGIGVDGDVRVSRKGFL